jgi:tetratricopeptide (TPR) repeat protein
MKNITVTKTGIVIAWIIILMSVAGLFAAEAPVPASLESNGDGAFAEDLRAVEDMLRNFSYDRGMSGEEARVRMEESVRKAKEFFAFAREKVLPHTAALAAGMKDPAGMIEKGRQMTEADPASWQGYDFMATGSLLVDDPSSAMRNFEKAYAAAPEAQKDWYRYMIAGCHNASKSPEKAMAIYEEVIARNRNWTAVKSAYVSASITLLGRDNAKAAEYFDKGLALYTPAERTAMLGSGVCGKFKGLAPQPETCSGQRG